MPWLYPLRRKCIPPEYQRHASVEETEFLPLAQEILERNSNHLAALGLSLHMRHVKPVNACI